MAQSRRIACLCMMMAVAGAAAQGHLRPVSVPKPSLGSLGSIGGKTGKLATYDGPSLKELVASFDSPIKAPRYTGPGAKPDLQLMTQTWQRAFNQAAAGSTGGTWTINDMVKSLQGTLTKMANENATEAAPGAAAGDAAAAPASNVTFEEFAGSLVCRQGAKLANCSGVNPCAHKKCMVGTMCMVDMCGACSAKCVSYAEIGAGLNKVMSTLGLGGVKADLPTPNLPLVDNLISGVRNIKRSLLPRCGANQVLEVSALRCRTCDAGSVADAEANQCVVCGKGSYADLKSGGCKKCNPGFFSASATGNRFCVPCPAGMYNDASGQQTCMACPDGTSTGGKRAQTKCVADA